MLIQLHLESKEPIYTQLRNQIIEGIAKKEIESGEELPSIRSLASDLGINLHTVNKAYKQLEREGFIIIQRNRGALIHPDGIPRADDAYWEKLHSLLYPLIAESICRDVDEKSFLQFCSRIFATFNQESEDKQ